jgi:nickel/cobalt exporter
MQMRPLHVVVMFRLWFICGLLALGWLSWAPVAIAQQTSGANPLMGGASSSTDAPAAAASPFGTPAPSDAPSAAPAATDPAGQAGAEAAPSEASEAPGLLHRAGSWLLAQQRYVNRIINTQLAAIKRGEDGTALWGGLIIAFLYGVFHVLGPGHGKTVIAGYFLGHHASWTRGIAMACWMAVSHVVAAIGIVLVLHVILSHSFATPVDEMMWLRFVSYGAIVLIGLAMLVETWRGKAVIGCAHDHGAHDHAHHHHDHSHHDQGHHHGHSHTVSLKGDQSLLAIAAGFVPCSGAILILVFCLTNSLIWQGVMMTLMIALGMAITLSAIGLASIFLRRQTLGRVSDTAQASRILGYVGPALITLIGILLLTGAYIDPMAAG